MGTTNPEPTRTAGLAPVQAASVLALVARVQRAQQVKAQLSDLLLPALLSYVNSLAPGVSPTEPFTNAIRHAVKVEINAQRQSDLATHIQTQMCSALRSAIHAVEVRQLPLFSDEFQRGPFAELIEPAGLYLHLESPAIHNQELWSATDDANQAFSALAAFFEPQIRHFSRKAAQPGSFQAEEIRQECLGKLYQAALTFVPAGACSFRTFAINAMSKATTSKWRLEDDGTEHRSRQNAEFRKAQAALAHENGRMPHEHEVFERLGWKPTKISNFQQAAAMRSAGRKELRPGACPPASDGDDASAPLCRLENDTESETARHAFDQLDPLSQKVLNLRLILGQTTLATARAMSTSKKAIEQMEAAALNQLTDIVLAERTKSATHPSNAFPAI